VISIGVPFGIKIESALIVRIFPRASLKQPQSEIIDSASSSSDLGRTYFIYKSLPRDCLLCFVFHDERIPRFTCMNGTIFHDCVYCNVNSERCVRVLSRIIARCKYRVGISASETEKKKVHNRRNPLSRMVAQSRLRSRRFICKNIH